MHTLKGSARLAGAAAWARQVHALETLAFAPHSSPEALAEPIEALRLGFAALQQEMALHAPQAPSQQQPLETLQRHTQALWISHTQAQEATAQSQSAITEMAASLQRLHTLVQDCKVWANTLMVYGDMELSYEWHSELQDLLAGLLSATDDLGTVQQQLQHHHQESTHALATQTGYLQGLQHSLLYASLQPLGIFKSAWPNACAWRNTTASGKPICTSRARPSCWKKPPCKPWPRPWSTCCATAWPTASKPPPSAAPLASPPMGKSPWRCAKPMASTSSP